MIIDIAFLVALIYGCYLGITSGFFNKSLTVVKIAVALVVGLKVTYLSLGVIESKLTLSFSFLPLLVFIVMFLLSSVVINFFIDFVARTLRLGDSYNFERILGFGAWVAIVVVSFSILLNQAEGAELLAPSLLADSSAYPVVEPIYPMLACKMSFISPGVEYVFGSFKELLDGLSFLTESRCYS